MIYKFLLCSRNTREMTDAVHISSEFVEVSLGEEQADGAGQYLGQTLASFSLFK